MQYDLYMLVYVDCWHSCTVIWEIFMLNFFMLSIFVGYGNPQKLNARNFVYATIETRENTFRHMVVCMPET